MLHMQVKLPNAPMRDRILRVMLKDEQLSDDFDFPSISGDPVTQGFSGSDLRNVCIAAAYKPLRDYLVQVWLRHLHPGYQTTTARRACLAVTSLIRCPPNALLIMAIGEAITGSLGPRG